MIITCEQCSKRFEIESKLIPEKGRLLQCSSCNLKWFYKKKISEESKVVLEEQHIKPKNTNPIIQETNDVKIFDDSVSSKKPTRKHSYDAPKTKKISFLNIILVFIISIIALIILVDTFKNPISLILPETEYILESLYETLKDILLFTQDLF
jgi:predicted Zn finger-like uncharacterized protein